jgi:hypothetical protein
LVHIYHTFSLLPCLLPIMASASLRLLYSLNYPLKKTSPNVVTLGDKDANYKFQQGTFHP